MSDTVGREAPHAMGDRSALSVRESGPEDEELAGDAAALIEQAAERHDIAIRTPEWLAAKIVAGHAALALRTPEPRARESSPLLVGFGYWSAWEGGRFVSHSGLVVRPDLIGEGLGRRLKQVLFGSTRRLLPRAAVMSLTTSPEVRGMNLSLGFRVVPFERLTQDEAFWEGCRTCRNYAEVQARGERCCCEAMLLEPDGMQTEGPR